MKLFAGVFTFIFFLCAFLFNSKHSRFPAGDPPSLADRNYRRSYISLDNSFSYAGLTHRPGRDSEYVRRLFGKLIQIADKKAQLWREENFDIYQTFLLASLAVPLHESSLMHFTRRDPQKYCYFSNDVLVDIKLAIDQLEKTKTQGRQVEIKLNNARYLDRNIKRFYEALGNGQDLFQSCDELSSLAEVQQLLFSNDYADVGLMMLNSSSHGSFFRAERIFYVDEVIHYGLSYLYDGFEEIALNNLEYPCLVAASDSKDFTYRLIQGAWSGKYNSGNVSKTCRFTDPNNRYHRNDVSFNQKLLSLFEGNSLFHQYLPLNSIERELLDLFVSENSHELKKTLDLILATNYQGYEYENQASIDVEVEKKSDGQNEKTESDTQLADTKSAPLDPLISESPLPEYFTEPQAEAKPLPLKKIEEKRGLFKGVDINLRVAPEIANDNICVNTRELAVNLEFKIKSEIGEFYEIEFKSRLNIDLCQKDIFVHKNYVRVIHEEIGSLKLIELSSWVALRDKPGMKRSIIVGAQGPGEVSIIAEKIFSDRYLWLSFFNSEGRQVWFYAGKDGKYKFTQEQD